MNRVSIALLTLALAPCTSPTLAADSASSPAAVTQAGVSVDSAISDGEVKKVDKDAEKLTIKHGPLVNLGMPGMTMVFRVKDPAMLDQVKVGDKVKFRADKVNSAFTVVEIEVIK